ncbi:MAG: aryl-sulfate sulfotransferase [Pseudomonadota bacterium]
MHRALLPLLTLSLLGCNDFEVIATLDEEAPMVVRLAWTTPEPGKGWAEFGLNADDLGMRTSTEPEDTTEHSLTLLGAPPLADVYFRAVTETGSEELEARGTIRTEGLPAELPDFVVTVDEPEKQAPLPYILGTAFGGMPAVYVVDRQAHWLWYKQVDRDKNPIQLAFEEGTGHVLFNSFLTDHGEDDSNITRVSFDRRVDEDMHTPYGHHSFTQLPDGSLAYLSIDVRDFDVFDTGEPISVVGDAVMILPVDGGEPYAFWSTWDWRDPHWHDRWDSGFYPQGGDWTHCNAVNYVASNDTLLVSVRNFDVLLEVDMQSGAVLREFGGEDGYRFAEGSRTFNYQHDATWTVDDTLLLITTDEEVRETTAVEYAVDDGAQTLTEIWSQGDGEGHYALVQGTARDLSNGNRLINYGSVGLVQEVTLDHEVVWEMKALAGTAFGNTVPFPDLYDPLGLGD